MNVSPASCQMDNDFIILPFKWRICIPLYSKAYDYTSLGDTVLDVYKDVFFGETIIAGASKRIHIGFYVPYTLQEKKYVMCVDWRILNFEYEYFLYLSDGSNFYNGNIA